jgi:hypothetical protein
MFLSFGAMAGAIAQSFVHPMDVVRRRMQVATESGEHWTIQLKAL